MALSPGQLQLLSEAEQTWRFFAEPAVILRLDRLAKTGRLAGDEEDLVRAMAGLILAEIARLYGPFAQDEEGTIVP